MVVVGWVRLKIPLPQVWILQTSLGDILVPLQECIIILPCRSLHKSSHILTLYNSCLIFWYCFVVPNASIERWFLHVPTLAKGFDLTSRQLVITPNLFAPERLCSCNPGWNLSCKDLDLEWFGSLFQLAVLSSFVFLDVCLLHAVPNRDSWVQIFLQSNIDWATLEQLRHGQGSQCEMCPPNYFKNDTHAPRPCMPCPEGSTAPRGSTSHENCKCEVGELFEKDGELKLDRTKYLTAVRFLSCLMFVGVSVMFNLNKSATELHQCIGNVRKVM